MIKTMVKYLKKLKYLLNQDISISNKKLEIDKLNNSIRRKKLELTYASYLLKEKAQDYKIINSVNYLLKPRFGCDLEALLEEFLDKLPNNYDTESFRKIIKEGVK